jgi:hypothetical protein
MNPEKGEQTRIGLGKLNLIAGLAQSQEIAAWSKVLEFEAAAGIGLENRKGNGPMGLERKDGNFHSRDGSLHPIHDGACVRKR